MSIRISLTIAQMNVMLECVSSGMEWISGQINRDDIDDEAKRNLVAKSVILGEVAMKLVKQAGPYLESTPAPTTSNGEASK